MQRNVLTMHPGRSCRAHALVGSPTDRRGVTATADLGFVRHRPFAHRGLHDISRGVPENSLAAVELAVRAGLGVEIDVRLSRAGTALVFHDARLDRMCGAPSRLIERPDTDLRRLRLAGTDQRIPALPEVLDLVDGTAPLLLDLKCRLRGSERRRLATAVADALRDYAGPVAAVSFDPLVLRAIAATAPRVPRGQSAGVPRLAPGLLLTATRPLDRFWLNPVSLPHFLTFNVDRLPFASLQTARERGILALGWTVRAREQLNRLAHHVDNVIVEGPAACAVAT